MTNSIMESNNNERIRPETKKYFISCNYKLFKGFVGQNLILTDTYLKIVNAGITIPLRQITGVEIIKSNSPYAKRNNVEYSNERAAVVFIGLLAGLVFFFFAGSLNSKLAGLLVSFIAPIYLLWFCSIKHNNLLKNGKTIVIDYGKSTFVLIGLGRDKEESLRFYNDSNEYISMYASTRN